MTSVAASITGYPHRCLRRSGTCWKLVPYSPKITAGTPEEFQIGPLAGDVHAATQALLDEAISAARALLTNHLDVLTALVDLLLVEETLDLAAVRRPLEERQAAPAAS
jgi:hypothetical protein